MKEHLSVKMHLGNSFLVLYLLPFCSSSDMAIFCAGLGTLILSGVSQRVAQGPHAPGSPGGFPGGVLSKIHWVQLRPSKPESLVRRDCTRQSPPGAHEAL